MALACLAILRCRGVDCRGAPLGLPGPVSLPPTCVTGASGASILSLGINSSASSSGGGREDAPEGGSGGC